MATLSGLGPSDHGRPLTLAEFRSGDYQPGFRYELIKGKLYVSPFPEVSAALLDSWITWNLNRYEEQRPDVINFVFNKCRVFVPRQKAVSAPEPDLAAYVNFPSEAALAGRVGWEDVSPVLVVEILDPEDPAKDLVRNVRLYRLVPSIREYWVIDPRPDPERPALIVRRRSGSRWRVLHFAFGSTYTTPLLPGFALVVDPRG
jgi:Uma2 family endonuclease